MSHQPYAPPADDGGDQGSFTRPQDSMAQANSADPADRIASGSLWTGVKEQSSPHEGTGLSGRARSWTDFQHVWKAQALMLLMIFVFAGMALLGGD